MKKIIAIIWRAGSGKDHAGDFLSKKLWIPSMTISEALRISARKRGIEETRENLIIIGQEFAKKYWDEYLVKIIIENNSSPEIIITWMRQVGQLEYCKKYHETTFIWIESSSKQRYKRLIWNNKTLWTYKEFLETEKLDEGNIQNVWKCLKLCDSIIENNESIEEFEKEIKRILK